MPGFVMLKNKIRINSFLTKRIPSPRGSMEIVASYFWSFYSSVETRVLFKVERIQDGSKHSKLILGRERSQNLCHEGYNEEECRLSA